MQVTVVSSLNDWSSAECPKYVKQSLLSVAKYCHGVNVFPPSTDFSKAQVPGRGALPVLMMT